MEANEAPEKIYMTPSFGEPDNVLLASFSKSHLEYHRDIEYARIDAFIEKAVSYILSHKPDMRILGDSGVMDELIVKDFAKYMKGE